MTRDLNLTRPPCACKNSGMAVVGGRLEYCLCEAGKRETICWTWADKVGRPVNQIVSEQNQALAKMTKESH